MSNSILSHGERDVATKLANGLSPTEIANARDVPLDEIEKSIDRIHDKTERAFTTLAESPFTEDVAAELDEETKADVLRAFDDA